MMFNTCKHFFAILLFSTTLSSTSGSARDLTSTTHTDQCTVAENTRSDEFCFAVEIEIEGLRFDEICTNHRTRNLEKTLLKYHNEAIDCACNNNGITYTDVQIVPAGFEIVSGYGGDLDWCERRNARKNLRRDLHESDEVDFVDRSLRPNYLDLYPNYLDVTKVRYFARGTCGTRCPTNVFPGSSCFNCNRDGGSFFYGDRHLTNDDLSECFESLFVNVLSSNPRFGGVTGVEVIRGTSEDPSVCDVTTHGGYVAPKVTPIVAPIARTGGKKGSKSKSSGKKGSVSAKGGKKGSESAKWGKKGSKSAYDSKSGSKSAKSSTKGSKSK